MTAPKLSVVFVNYNSTELASRAIASLRRSSCGVTLEILVVDNASADRAAVRSLCAGSGVKVLLLTSNLGYGPAANRAARYASGEYLAIANPDLEFPDGALRDLVSFMDSTPRAGVVGPQLVYPDGSLQPSARRYPRLRYVFAGRRSPLVRAFPGLRIASEFQYLEEASGPGPLRVESVVGPFMVFRKAAFDSVGGFDEGFFMYSEDVDICRRIAANWSVYLLPSAQVLHYVGQTRRRYRRFTEYHRVRSLRRFWMRNVGVLGRGLLSVLLAGYLAMLLWFGLMGAGEHEYSWRSKGKT
ncbi:MAG: glycosyltransferase family 2 protein [candidate division WOR-3 bacterium]|nr:MAG: glycosyltransferase family 2 protein [candidate division WOR-3 bacterium]